LLIRSHLAVRRQILLYVLSLLDVHPVSEIVLEVVGTRSPYVLTNCLERISLNLHSDQTIDEAYFRRKVREVVV